jgi:phosphoglycolate phosphatase
MLTNIKAVIIDLDGTMVDTAPDFHYAINHMRAELDLPPIDIESIKQFVGKGTEHLVRCALSIDLNERDVERHFSHALALYQKHYAPINGVNAAIYPGVKEGLQALKAKGLKLACVTNKPLDFAMDLLNKKELHPYFDLVFGGDSFPRKKPDPLPLMKVFEAFSLSPRQIVAIGDSVNDAQAARAAGCWVLNVPYGYNHGQAIQKVDSDGIVQSLLDAAHVISV